MGLNIQKNLQRNIDTWSKVTWEDMATYIGPNADYYRAAFDQNHKAMTENGRPKTFTISWHWAAFIPILGIPWAAARKQWLFVAIMVGAIVLVSIISAFLPSASSGFLMFVAAILAKNYYIQMGVAKIVKIKDRIPAGPARDAAIQEAGGINMTYGYVAGAVCFCLLGLSILSLFVGTAG